jgi:hypothetical protein
MKYHRAAVCIELNIASGKHGSFAENQISQVAWSHPMVAVMFAADVVEKLQSNTGLL